MNILVIGNGFDLAHELPTKYTDFLFFCKIVLEIIKENHIEVPKNKGDYIKWIKEFDKNFQLKADITNQFVCSECIGDIAERDKKVYKDIFYKYFIQDFLNENYDLELIKEIFYLVYDNFWIEYFGQCDMHGDENWIDFESEISRVIQSLDDDMHGLSQIYNIEDIVYDLSNSFLKEMYSDYIDAAQPINPIINGFFGVTFKEIRNKLLDDLNRLIRTFEIYLTDYVERIDCKLVSPDIQKILPKEYMKVNEMSVYDGCVLSFNYTNTYQRLYVDKKYIDYIHGKADINNTIESNNMVLGIDEYLGKKRRNKDIEFIAFKKYYQRIYKQTGSEYKRWVEIIKNQMQEIDDKIKNQHPVQIPYNKIPNKYRNQLYFFGHSLDITDKDILRDLILNDNVYTTIFYVNKDVMGQQIANLVKVIGQDELIRRTGGSTKTIEFKQQQKMEPVKSQQSEENRA